MDFKINTTTSFQKIKKCSVDKAIELLNSKIERRKKSSNTKKRNRRIINCTNSLHNKMKNIVALSKSRTLLEMRSYIARQDWTHALNLFPKLLEYPIEIESIAWRYFFIILLHDDDPLHLNEFIQTCINNRNSIKNNSELLKKLFLLPKA